MIGIYVQYSTGKQEANANNAKNSSYDLPTHYVLLLLVSS